MVGRWASLDGRLFLGGTDGSNPAPSSAESANYRETRWRWRLKVLWTAAACSESVERIGLI